MEAALLGGFLLSACVFGVLLEHPGSRVHQAIESALLRRVLMGAAMGCTLVAIVYSAWGKRSGAHINPSVTLTFLALGKIERWDAVFYVTSQFVGGIVGVLLAELLLGAPLAHSGVNYAATVPGPAGAVVAFWAEAFISALMMSAILVISNARPINRYTGLVAAALLALFILFEAPFSGVSLNPARTTGSAVWAGEWTAIGVYFTAPPLAMLLAAQVYRRRRGARAVLCAKLHHDNRARCIFRCNYGAIDVQK